MDASESERINYLILALASDNARVFADKCGIHPASLSKLRNGKFHLTKYSGRILSGYPQINRDWLLYGIGEPIKKKPDEREIAARLGDLEKKVDKILALMEKYREKG